MVVGLRLGGRVQVRLVSGGTEVGGGGLRDWLAVNERTRKKPVRLVISISVLLSCDRSQRRIPFSPTLGIRY